MPKRWHKGGCNEETWEEKCPRCEGWGYMHTLTGQRTCSQCNGKKVVCGNCHRAY